jgi:hypothetical protein
MDVVKKVQAALSDYKWLSPDAPLPPRVTSETSTTPRAARMS